MRNRVLILCILLALFVSGCAKKSQTEAFPAENPAETTVPVDTEPELEYVTAQVDGIPVVMRTFSRGDTLDIVEAFDADHYVVKLDFGYGLVEKNLVRMESEPAFESWTGYTYQNAAFYDHYRLAGKPVKNLDANTQVKVLDDLGWCVLVEYAGTTGYMNLEMLSKTEWSDVGSDEKNAGEDGGEISLRFSAEAVLLSTITPQTGSVTSKASVLADRTDVVLGYFDRGDRIPVLKGAVEEGQWTVYLDGICASVSGAYVCPEEETPYEIWKGRSKAMVSVYDDFWMLGSPIDRLNANEEITVLYELENCYLVEVGTVSGYIPKDLVIPAKTEAKPEEIEPIQPGQTKPAPEEATKPTQSKPAEPAPTEPKAPEQSKPAEPAPTEPKAPEQSKPAEPAPTEPKVPEQSEPTEPVPTEPKVPEQSEPTEPASTEPEVPDQKDPANPEATTTPVETKPSGEGSAGTGSGNSNPEWTPPIL